MESTKQNFLSWAEIDRNYRAGFELNPIDTFIFYNELGEDDQYNKFRTQLFEAINYWDEESLTDHNANVICAFIEHCDEMGFNIPDGAFESYFGA